MNAVETLSKGYNVIAEQVAKPDHPLWKKISNWVIIVGGPVAGLLIRLFVPEEYRELANQILIAILAALKATTALTVAPKSK